MKRRRAFLYVYALIALFCAAGVTAGGLIALRSAGERITAQHVESSRLFLGEAVTAINLIVDTVFDSAARFQGDSIIAALIARGGTADPLERQAILTRLGQIRDNGKYIHSVALYLAPTGQVLDTGYGYCDLADFPDQGWLPAYRSSEREITLIDHRTAATSVHAAEPQAEVITLLIRLPVGRLRPEGALIVNIDPRAIYEQVVSRMGLGDRSELIVLGREGHRILGGSLSHASLDRLLAALGGRTSALWRNGRETMLVTRIPSSLLGWDFIWVRSFDDVKRALAALRAVVAAGSGLLLAVLLAVGVLIARAATRPIDDVIASFDAPRGGRLNPLKEIGAAFEGLMQRNRSLAERLETVLPLYRERFLQGLLEGADPPDRAARCAEFGVQIEGRDLVVVALETLNMYQLREQGLCASAVRFGLGEIVERTVSRRALAAYKVHGEESRLDLIVSLPPGGGEEAGHAAVDLAARIAASAVTLGLDLAAGVSTVAADAGELRRLGSESRLALERRKLGGVERVVVFGDSDSRPAAGGPALAGFEEDLRRALVLGDPRRGVEVVRSTLAALPPDASPSALADLVLQVYGLASRYAAEPIAGRVTGGTPLPLALAEIRSLPAAELFLSRVVAAVAAQRADLERDAEWRQHRRIMQHIDGQYANPALSMSLLASRLHLSPSYVYRVLREREGRTFVELVTERRLEKAKALLRQDLRVQDVAAGVGFSSARYFIKVFRQQTGYTPNRYRKIV
jgi:AraC-like DNA-binding protein